MGESFVDSWRNDAQVYGECENYGVMKGHANAVLEAQISAMAAMVKGVIISENVPIDGFPSLMLMV